MIIMKRRMGLILGGRDGGGRGLALPIAAWLRKDSEKSPLGTPTLRANSSLSLSLGSPQTCPS
jgi:hypothetical protein